MIGIVTVLYNSESVLQDFFASLEHQTYRNFVLYVIDNASPDKSLEVAKRLADKASFKVVFIENSVNGGIAQGNNIGIVEAIHDKCDYVLFSNNDITIAPNAIKILLDSLISLSVDMVVPKIYFHNSSLIWYAGGRFDCLRGGAAHLYYKKTDSDKYSKRKQYKYAPTCFLLIKTSTIKEVGFMDERYFVYYDDTDYLFRARTKKLLYIPEAQVWHKESISTGGAESDFSLYYKYRNVVYYNFKHFNVFRIGLLFLYSIAHYFFLKKTRMTSSQCNIVKKAYKDGLKMCNTGQVCGNDSLKNE